MKLLRNILTLLLVVAMVGVGVLFSLQNKTPVPLDLLIYVFEPRSLALWVLGSFALGGILGMLLSSVLMVRMRTSASASRRQLERTRTELARLKDEAPLVEGS